MFFNYFQLWRKVGWVWRQSSEALGLLVVYLYFWLHHPHDYHLYILYQDYQDYQVKGLVN